MKVLSDEQMGKLLEDYPLSYKSPSGEPNSIGAIYKRVEERNKAIAQAQLDQDKKDVEACIDGRLPLVINDLISELIRSLEGGASTSTVKEIAVDDIMAEIHEAIKLEVEG